MMNDSDIKRNMLLRLKSLNSFIRELETFAEQHGINIEGEKLYIIACAQRNLLRDILDINT